MERLKKKGMKIQPVEIDGRAIARTFWGRAWCEHIEQFHDFENRLPRGRTYVRNGSVCHLAISEGLVEAKVAGYEVYDVEINIEPLSKKKWRAIKESCRGQIGSVLELLQGKLSDHVMSVVTDPEKGLFPLTGEIDFSCSCPDWAVMCKHVAATLYGVGARLDQQPELLFVLRGVDYEELIETAVEIDSAISASEQSTAKRLKEDELADVFGIELDLAAPPAGGPAAEPAGDKPAKTKKTARRARKSASTKTRTAKTKARKAATEADLKAASCSREKKRVPAAPPNKPPGELP